MTNSGWLAVRSTAVQAELLDLYVPDRLVDEIGKAGAQRDVRRDEGFLGHDPAEGL